MSLRSHEGYLYIDHRSNAGVSEADALAAGLPIQAARGVFEAPTYTCSHCQKVCIVKLPRETEVPYCPKCDHHICGTCGKRREANGGECRPFKKLIEEVLEQAERQADTSLIILP